MGIFSRDDSPAADRPSSRVRARSASSALAPVTSPVVASAGPLSVFSSTQDIPPYSVYRPLTAAASVIKINDKGEVEQFKNRRSSAASAWQTEAWEYYDAIGEIKYAFNLVASVVSRIRLYAAVSNDPSDAPVPVDSDARLDPALAAAAQRALARLNSAYGGQPGLLRDAALNLSVTGECYLVQVPERPGQGLPETWDIRSTDELSVDPRGGTMVTPRRDLAGGGMSSNKGGFQLPNRAFVGRIWRPHPRYSDEADSSLRGMLDLCAELLLLNRTFRATARSRLNAGALYLPDGLSVAASPDPDYPYDDDLDLSPGMTAEEAADEFEDQLIDAMTTPIRDEDSASAVVPLIIRGPAELGDKIKQFKFERSFDPALAQRADRVLERILQGLDVPKDVVTGLANVKYCVPPSTEVLTRRGWRHYDELQLGEDVYTLNHVTGLAEWQPVTAVNTFDVVDEPMHVEVSNTHASITTAGHRWPTIRKHRKYGTRRVWATSETLRSNDRFIVAAPSIDTPSAPKYSDEFVELVAWFYTEGCYSPRVNRDWSGLGQSQARYPENVDRIRRVLTALFGAPYSVANRSEAAAAGALNSRDGAVPQWREAISQDGSFVNFHFNHELTHELEVAFDDLQQKIVSLDFINSLTFSQLELFIDVSILADGHGTSERGMVWQDVPKRLDALELACAMVGRATRRIQDGKFLRITTRRPLVRPSKSQRREISYTGVVWCPTTPNGTWFAREDGKSYFTGNSNAVQIDENLYKAHIEPLMLLIVDALTVVYLRPYLLAQGWSPADVAKVVIWYDPTAVATRNDRAADADMGFDRHAVSFDTWRRAHGFSDADAPTANELALRMMLEKGQMLPELVESMLNAVAPEMMNAARGASQAASRAPIPPEVQQMLKGGAPASPGTDTTTPSPADTASPTAPESTGEGADELLPE